jgi:hypothetical protein
VLKNSQTASWVWGFGIVFHKPGLTLQLPMPPLPPLSLQLSIPQLRSNAAQRSFNSELANCDYDLDTWRR